MSNVSVSNWRELAGALCPLCSSACCQSAVGLVRGVNILDAPLQGFIDADAGGESALLSAKVPSV
jgi:hypothetical protein